jgi:CheY-like chemotaxis protein
VDSCDDGDAFRRVLVVDDDDDILESIGDVLRSGGYRVWLARDGSEALTHVAEQCPHVVLLDWRLPVGPAGAPLVRKLRESCGFTLPVVVLSADPASLAEAQAAEVSDYLPKPFDVGDLLHLVDSYAA